ncbi:MAG: ABC transporter ATP-binding protein/permease [Armatimonadetes bacterium]|nr:ABC transporter ATP-binding protein/permease [Armatimonadota bacterium]
MVGVGSALAPNRGARLANMKFPLDSQRRLLRYVLTYKGRLAAAAICGLLMAGCNLILARMINWFATALSGSGVMEVSLVKFGLSQGWFAPGAARMALILIVAVLVVLIHIPKAVFGYANAYLVASVTNRIGADVRRELYAHLQTLPLSFFHRNKIGHIISRMTYDVGLITNSSQVVMQAIDGPVLMVTGLAGLFAVSWKLAVMTIVFVPAMGVLIDRLSRKIRGLTVDTQARLADVNAVVEETCHGARIVKSFGMEEHEIERFERANNASLIASLRAARRASAVLPSIDLMGGLSGAVLLLAGGLMVVAGEIKIGKLFEFTYLAFIVAAAGKQFGRLNMLYQQTMAGAERIFELLDTKSDLVEKPDAVTLQDVKGRVEFRDVVFEYNDGEKVLDGVSFVIEPGEVVALVGPSGAGKSTIADLIPRFYDVTGGQVLVEGYDVRDIKIASLREHIAVVPQETILFSGTIAENIAYGRPDADMSEIVAAAKAANAHEFIEPLPNGYQTQLGEGGAGLSGGQRQRIAIARALLKNPRILILDEATSSLDAASEVVVQEALDRLMRGRSTLVIAHRLSTVTGADRILVIDHGRIVESGSFEELVGRSGVFAQLYRTQFRAEEVV